MKMQYNNQHDNLLAILQSGLSALGLQLSPIVQDKIIKYIMLLYVWNQTYNLTAVRDPKLILIRHVFDSLAVAPFIVGPNVLDFGTGAGLPGIPLALALPENKFVLLDSSNKKTIFLNHVALTLNIKNINIVTKRIETFFFASGFVTIITRATTSLDDIVNKTKRLCAKKGQILVMQGKCPTKELAMVTQPIEICRLKVPYLDEERHLLKIFN